MRSNNKELSKAGFDRDAADYDQSSKYASLRLSYVKIADEALRSPFRYWLDVGCGTGALLGMIGRQKESIKLFGI